MKILIVSGFLGSGKTTFINRLVKKLDDVAILENDYANADIDSELLKDSGKEIVSLEEGCICCSKKTDFATSVLTISNSLDPQYLIVEPTGVGYLSKVINNIKSIAYDKIEILSPITIVDYFTIDETLRDYEDLFVDQIKNAGHILISKTEDVKEADIEAAREKLARYTSAEIYPKHYDGFSAEEWDSLISSYDLGHLDEKDLKELHVHSHVYEDVSFPDFQALGTVFNAICSDRFGKVLRGKGFVKVGDKLVKIDIVQGRFSVEKQDSPVDKLRLVFIGNHLDEEAFDILFKGK